MTTMNVRFEALAEAVDHVHACHGALTQEKETLDNLLNDLRGTWQGEAGLNWQQVQADWNGAHADVMTILRNLRVALELAHGNYTGTEKGLRQMWGGR